MTNPVDNPRQGWKHGQRSFAWPLGREKNAIIDELDISLLKKHRWHADKIGGTWYVYRKEGKRKIYLHREILQAKKGELVDHINMDGLDNRRSNLRLVGMRENSINRRLRADNKSGYRGVCWATREGKWRASFRDRGKQVHVGFFNNPKEAARAWNRVAKRIRGDLAVLNLV